MSSRDNTERMTELRKKVQTYAQLPTVDTKKPVRIINMSSPVIYIVIPIICLTLLSILRPPFVKTEYEDKNGKTRRRFSFYKLLMSSLIFGVILDIILWIYMKEKI